MQLTILKIVEMIVPPFVNSLVKKISKKKHKRKIVELKNHDIFSTMTRVRNEVGNLKYFRHIND